MVFWRCGRRVTLVCNTILSFNLLGSCTNMMYHTIPLGVTRCLMLLQTLSCYTTWTATISEQSMSPLCCIRMTMMPHKSLDPCQHILVLSLTSTQLDLSLAPSLDCPVCSLLSACQPLVQGEARLSVPSTSAKYEVQ